MNFERLRLIIDYSKNHRKETDYKVKNFCSFSGVGFETDLLSIMQIVRPSLRKRGYIVIEIPIADDEIGALSYKGDGLGYVLINSSLPKVNVNFAIAHEIFHVFFQEDNFVSKVEFSDDHYYEHEEEFAANLFAGMLLMPEISFRMMYSKFKDESEGIIEDIIVRLMSYYQVPFMAALIRCLELELLGGNDISETILNIDRKKIKQKLNELWLDESILDSSKKDDYIHLKMFVSQLGEEYVKEEYINKGTLKNVLNNMEDLYLQIKGE